MLLSQVLYYLESNTRSATGLGMGLTLARQALERMGGELTLEASGPAGSTFLIELPRYLPEGDEGACDPDGHPA